MLGRQPHPGGASRGIQMRRSLSHQIRQPEQPLRAQRRACGLGHQRVVLDTGSQVRAKPLQAEPGALRDTHDVPLARHGVAERMDAAGRVISWRVLMRKDHAGSPQRAGSDAGFDNAIAHRASRLIAAPTHHRRAGLESGGRRGSLGDHPGCFL